MCPSCQFLLWNVPTVNIWVWALSTVCPPAHVFCCAAAGKSIVIVIVPPHECVTCQHCPAHHTLELETDFHEDLSFTFWKTNGNRVYATRCFQHWKCPRRHFQQGEFPWLWNFKLRKGLFPALLHWLFLSPVWNDIFGNWRNIPRRIVRVSHYSSSPTMIRTR